MELLRQSGAILLVFGLLAFAIWKLRRSPQTRSVTSIERIPLTQKHILHLVKIHNRELLIATHPAGCSILNDLTSRDCQGADGNRDCQGADRRS